MWEFRAWGRKWFWVLGVFCHSGFVGLRAILRGSWVVIHGVISRVTILITGIRGL